MVVPICRTAVVNNYQRKEMSDSGRHWVLVLRSRQGTSLSSGPTIAPSPLLSRALETVGCQPSAPLAVDEEKQKPTTVGRGDLTEASLPPAGEDKKTNGAVPSSTASVSSSSASSEGSTESTEGSSASVSGGRTPTRSSTGKGPSAAIANPPIERKFVTTTKVFNSSRSPAASPDIIAASPAFTNLHRNSNNSLSGPQESPIGTSNIKPAPAPQPNRISTISKRPSYKNRNTVSGCLMDLQPGQAAGKASTSTSPPRQQPDFAIPVLPRPAGAGGKAVDISRLSATAAEPAIPPAPVTLDAYAAAVAAGDAPTSQRPAPASRGFSRNQPGFEYRSLRYLNSRQHLRRHSSGDKIFKLPFGQSGPAHRTEKEADTNSTSGYSTLRSLRGVPGSQKLKDQGNCKTDANESGGTLKSKQPRSGGMSRSRSTVSGSFHIPSRSNNKSPCPTEDPNNPDTERLSRRSYAAAANETSHHAPSRRPDTVGAVPDRSGRTDSSISRGYRDVSPIGAEPRPPIRSSSTRKSSKSLTPPQDSVVVPDDAESAVSAGNRPTAGGRLLFRMESNSRRQLDEMMNEIKHVLTTARVAFTQTEQHKLQCTWNTIPLETDLDSDFTTPDVLRLELEVCKLQKAGMNGVRFKRLSGPVAEFKRVSQKLAEDLKL
nr:unnamed protein product [Spirometra erinaceieuropaei]